MSIPVDLKCYPGQKSQQMGKKKKNGLFVNVYFNTYERRLKIGFVILAACYKLVLLILPISSKDLGLPYMSVSDKDG